MEKDPLLTTAQDPILNSSDGQDLSDPNMVISRLESPFEAYIGDAEVENPQLVKYLVEGVTSYLRTDGKKSDKEFFASMMHAEFLNEILGKDQRTINQAVSHMIIDYLNLQANWENIPRNYLNGSVFPVMEVLDCLVTKEELQTNEMGGALSNLLKHRFKIIIGTSFYDEECLLKFFERNELDCSVFQSKEMGKLALWKIKEIARREIYAFGYSPGEQKSNIKFLRFILGEKDFEKIRNIAVKQLPIFLIVPNLAIEYFYLAKRLLSYEEALDFYPYTREEYESARQKALKCMEESQGIYARPRVLRVLNLGE